MPWSHARAQVLYLFSPDFCFVSKLVYYLERTAGRGGPTHTSLLKYTCSPLTHLTRTRARKRYSNKTCYGTFHDTGHRRHPERTTGSTCHG